MELPLSGGAGKQVFIQPIKMSLKNQTVKEEQFILENEFLEMKSDLTEQPSSGGPIKKVFIQPIKMSLKNETDNEEQFILENEFHQDHLKELVGMQYIKQEPFSSLDENDNKPANISELGRKQSLLMEQTCDIDIKSELPLEESKPVLKELVAVALFTPQEGMVLPAIQVKPETVGHFSEAGTKDRSTLSKPQYEEETEDKYIQIEIFQDDVTKNSHGLFPYPEELQRIDNAHEESASPKGAEIRFPKVTESNLRGGKHQKKRKKENLRGGKNKSTSCQFQEILFCDLCGKSFSRKCHLNRHMKNHINKRPYVCNECGSRYSRTDSLRRHRTLHIDAEKISLSKSVLRSHMCDMCGKGFRRRYDLQRHSIIHGNQKGHLCDRCGKTFTQLGDMKRHAMVHTGRELQECETCGKSFQERMSLLRHQVHHNKNKLLYCNFCGRGFTRKDCLQSHIFQHMPQKPFVCKYCGKDYAQPGCLQAHMYKHLGQKPFSCPDCEKCFASSAVLRQHTLKVHTSQKSSEDIKLKQT